MAILQPDVRASDHDRETAVALLKAHYAEGRLAEDELDWRSDAAYRAVGIRELARLTSDLSAARLMSILLAPAARASGRGWRAQLRGGCGAPYLD